MTPDQLDVANRVNADLVTANDFLAMSERSGSEIGFDIFRQNTTCQAVDEGASVRLPEETIVRLGATLRKLIIAAVTQYADSLKKQFDAL